MAFDLEMATAAQAVTPTAPPPSPRPRPGHRIHFSLKHTLVYITLIGGLSIASYFLFSRFLVESVEVSGISMVPTLHDGDHYMLNRWAYLFRPPQRGDVVVLKDPEVDGFAVKRVIATSGQAVLFKDGEVYVDNQKLTEPYLLSGTTTPTFTQPKEQLLLFGNNRYFVLGDNRLNSADSRFYGAVPRKKILGVISPE